MKRPVLLLLVILTGKLAMQCNMPAVVTAATYDRGREQGNNNGGSLSEWTYRRLVVIHKLMEDNKLSEALHQLNALLPAIQENGYEAALVHQTRGYVYVNMEDYHKAMESFEASLALNALPEDIARRTRYDLAQLYMATERYEQGIEALKTWLIQTPSPPPEAHVLAATGYIQLKRFREGIPHLRQAIAQSQTPREEWYQSLLAMHYELLEFREAAQVLEEMIIQFPDRRIYWKQLSTIYRTLKEEPKALATLELAYKRNLLEGKEIVNLANLYFYLNIPHKAGLVLEQGLKEGRIASNEANWKLLSNAWLQAKELGRALVALQQAADLSKEGELDVRRGRLLIELGSWEEAIQALKAGLSKGGIRNPGQVYYLLGIAHYETGGLTQSIASFEQALAYDKTKRLGAQWLQHVQAEFDE